MNAEKLEQNAVEQRNRIQRTTRELIDKVAHSSPSYYLSSHFVRFSLIASLAALVAGYVVGAVSASR